MHGTLHVQCTPHTCIQCTTYERSSLFIIIRHESRLVKPSNTVICMAFLARGCFFYFNSMKADTTGWVAPTRQ